MSLVALIVMRLDSKTMDDCFMIVYSNSKIYIFDLVALQVFITVVHDIPFLREFLFVLTFSQVIRVYGFLTSSRLMMSFFLLNAFYCPDYSNGFGAA